MSRTILTQRDIDVLAAVRTPSSAPAPVVGPDNYGTRILKYIPAEVVAVYIGIQGAIHQSDPAGGSAKLLWLVFGILLVLTPVYLWRVMHVTKPVQLIIATLSFAVWVFSLGGPFIFLSWYQVIYGAVLLPLYTFAVGIIIPNGGTNNSRNL